MKKLFLMVLLLCLLAAPLTMAGAIGRAYLEERGLNHYRNLSFQQVDGVISAIRFTISPMRCAA